MFWTYRLQRDKFGETALHIAIANDLHDQVYQMLCAGADFDVADFFGKTSRQMLTQKLELTKDPTLEKIMKRLESFIRWSSCKPSEDRSVKCKEHFKVPRISKTSDVEVEF